MRAFCLLVLVGVVLSGCVTTPTVVTESGPGESISDYKTYRWFLEAEDDPDINPLSNMPDIYKKVQSSVDAAMAAKGYRKASGNAAGMQIGFLIVVKRGMDTSILDQYFGSTAEEAITEVDERIPGMKVDDYRKGSLVLDFRENGTEDFIWRGAYDTNIKAQQTLEETGARIDEAVTAIFAKVPEAR
ncbi:MAG: DUF4136 domain-containing protein [Verrucomicrobiota bacterium]